MITAPYTFYCLSVLSACLIFGGCSSESSAPSNEAGQTLLVMEDEPFPELKEAVVPVVVKTPRSVQFEQDACLRRTNLDMVKLWLTDGAFLTLPRGWLSSVAYSGDAVEAKTVEAILDVTQIRLNMPVGLPAPLNPSSDAPVVINTSHQGEVPQDDVSEDNKSVCEQSVPVFVHAIDLPRAGKRDADPHPFKPHYSWIHAVKELTRPELHKLYIARPFETLSIGEIHLFRADPSSKKIKSDLLPRFDNAQLKLRAQYMQSEDLTADFFKTTAVGALLKFENNLGYFEYGPSEYINTEASVITVQFRTSEDYNAIISLTPSPQRLARFAVDSRKTPLRKFESTFKRLPYLQPVEDLEVVVKSAVQLGLIR